MSPTPEISESDLHAFIDGELDAARRAEVEAWIMENPDDAARVAGWREDRQLLHKEFDGVLDEPLPASVVAALDGPPNVALARTGPAPWLRWAAAVMLFVVGGGAGWLLRGAMGPDDAESFMRQAVSAHVVYIGERRHAVEVQAREERHLVAWLSKRLKHKITAPDLLKVGFRLVGGRMIADEGAPAAQFMYEDAKKRRITIYTRRSREDGETAFRFVGREGVSAFYWIGGPLSFAVLGKMSREELLAVARLVYEEPSP